MAELSAGAIVYTRYAMHHFTSNFRVEKVGMNFLAISFCYIFVPFFTMALGLWAAFFVAVFQYLF